MKGVIYAKYSSENQREESIEGQLRECREYADKQGITVLSTYIDRAYSAKTDNRPEFQRMIKDSSKHLFDVILVWKLDRFARNRYDSAYYKNILKKNRVRLISIKENISDGPEGIILESMLEGFAEYYSAELAVKVVRGMTENALKCRYNGGTVPLGYYVDNEGHFQIDELAAPYVIEAFTLYSEGYRIKDIVDRWNEKGITSARDGKVTINSVTHLLRNPRYTGEYRYHDVIIPEGMPAIISKELFDRVQERIAKNRRAPARHKAEEDYILTTKLHCGKCGALMVGECGTSSTTNVYHYYKCAKAKRKQGCKKRAVRKEWIEDLVVQHAMRIVMDDNMLEQIAESVIELLSKNNNQIPILEKKISDTQSAIENLLDAIQQGLLTPSTKTRLEELEARKQELEEKLMQEKLERPILTKEQILHWLYSFREIDISDLHQRQQLIDCFVNAVFLYDDRVVITFNYKDGSADISLDDIEDMECSDNENIGRP